MFEDDRLVIVQISEDNLKRLAWYICIAMANILADAPKTTFDGLFHSGTIPATLSGDRKKSSGDDNSE